MTAEMHDAATVILLRQRSGGPEVLMLRRNSRLAFGGMWVFPGGRIEDADHRPPPDDSELDTARRAAVREAFEEADVSIDATELIVFSHWTPPPSAPRRFATWFFAARAPAGAAGEVKVDGGEIHDHFWRRPADVIAARDVGEVELSPPTWVTLREIATAPDVDAVLEMAAGRQPERYGTRVAVDTRPMTLLWAGDAGYATHDATAEGSRHRLVMGDVWSFERSP